MKIKRLSEATQDAASFPPGEQRDRSGLQKTTNYMECKSAGISYESPAGVRQCLFKA